MLLPYSLRPVTGRSTGDSSGLGSGNKALFGSFSLEKKNLHLGKEGVHLIILGDDPPGGLRVPLHVGGDGPLDHNRRLAAHGADVLQSLPLLFLLEQEGNLRDIGALVPDAAQVGDHFQRRRDGPQVPGHRLLPEQQAQAVVLNVPLHAVHAPGGLDGGEGPLPVPVGEGGGHHVNGVLGGGGHIHQPGIELQKLRVKGFAHYPNLPVI